MGSFDVVPSGDPSNDRPDDQTPHYNLGDLSPASPHTPYEMEGLHTKDHPDFFVPHFTPANVPNKPPRRIITGERLTVAMSTAALVISLANAFGDSDTAHSLEQRQERAADARQDLNRELYGQAAMLGYDFHQCLDGTDYPQSNMDVAAARQEPLYDATIRSDVADEPPLRLTVDPTAILNGVQAADPYTQSYLDQHDC